MMAARPATVSIASRPRSNAVGRSGSARRSWMVVAGFGGPTHAAEEAFHPCRDPFSVSSGSSTSFGKLSARRLAERSKIALCQVLAFQLLEVGEGGGLPDSG